MRAPPSMIGSVAALRPLRRFPVRAAVFGVLIAAALLLALFPERHRAAVTLTPSDPGTLGLSGTLAQLGSINNVFGSQAAVEVALRVARSELARDYVIKKANLKQRLHENNRVELHRWLDDKVEIRSLRGGILLIDMQSRDPVLARDIVAAFAEATQNRLAEISRKQTEYKRDILLKLVDDASNELAEAQARYDTFRLRNRAPTPEAAVETVSLRIPQLETAIKAKQVAIAAARQLYTDDNNVVRQMSAELAALQKQLADVRGINPAAGQNVGRAVTASSQLFKLERDLTISRTLYDSYLQFLQGTTVEDLTSTANVRILEPPFVETERQVYLPALAAAIALMLLWAGIEFYRLRPPPGSGLVEVETQQSHA